MMPKHFVEDVHKLRRVIELCGDRLKVAGDILEYGDFFFIADEDIQFLKPLVTSQQEAIGRGEKVEREVEPIERDDQVLLCFWRDVVALYPWTAADLERETKAVAAYEGVLLKHLVKLLRFAVSGKYKGPGLYETLVELGKESVGSRIQMRIAGHPWNAMVKSWIIQIRENLQWDRDTPPKPRKQINVCMRIPDVSDKEPKEPVDSRDQYFQSVLDRGGGLITTGDWLGIMVAPESAITNCPPGWCFIPLELATLQLMRDAHDHMTAGKGRRDKWPKNQKVQPGKKQNLDEMLETLFDSQDYIG